MSEPRLLQHAHLPGCSPVAIAIAPELPIQQVRMITDLQNRSKGCKCIRSAGKHARDMFAVEICLIGVPLLLCQLTEEHLL